MVKIKKKKIDLFLDSGAFSAFTQGVEIDIYKYIQFIKQNRDIITVYANLDVIGDAEGTLKNQKIMEKAGLKPIPCFHLKEDFKYLRYYVKNYDYIALGGIAQAGRKAQLWMDKCFDIICDSKGRPKVKVHGFAVTSLRLIFRYPWYSVDSTSWVITGRLGSIYVPVYREGKPFYGDASEKISVSTRSPAKSKKGQHISNVSPLRKKQIMQYLERKGFKLGKSKFFKRPADYKLRTNERWAEKKGPKQRLVERIIIAGVSNDYRHRDRLNIIYFQDLERYLNKHPIKFKKNTATGFGL